MEESEEANRLNFIPCVKFVKRDVAKTEPEKVQLTKQELITVIEESRASLRELSVESAQAGNSSNQDEFNFDNYDETDENDARALGIESIADLGNNAEDNFSESDDSDKEDEVIKPTDNLILVGHVEGDASILEVYVYNEEEEALYVHHDILLPAFPLAIEWLNYEPNAPKGNYCAIGSMDPIIQIWDLDIINCIEPAFKLGSRPSTKKNLPRIGHKDAVLALAWNKEFDHILASGSVDKSIILWDMEHKTPSSTIKAFQDKVQCLQWHHLEAQTLLAGGCDKNVRVFDCRTPEPHKSWKLSGEVECLCWNPLEPFNFVAGTDKGTMHYVDCRQGELWQIEAHEKEITGLVVSPQCPGLLVTASQDGSVKTWDYTASTAHLVADKNFNIGNILGLSLSPDSPFVIAAGGDNKANNFVVHDLRNIDAVKNQFEGRALMELVPDQDTGEDN